MPAPTFNELQNSTRNTEIIDGSGWSADSLDNDPLSTDNVAGGNKVLKASFHLFNLANSYG